METATHHFELSDVLRRNVRNAGGEVLGRVEELLVHEASGRIEYIRLRLIGPDEAAGPSIEVPWSQFNWARGRLRLDMSREVLHRVAAAR